MRIYAALLGLTSRRASFLLVILHAALVPVLCFGVDDGTQLARAYLDEVSPRLDLPDEEQRYYGDLLTKLFAEKNITQAQYVVIADRNDFAQAAMIYWLSPERVFHFIGASPVSTGKPGKFDHFKTPTGIFRHTIENPDFRAEGTRNKLGIRGYGSKGMRVYDFGWQRAVRGWGSGGKSTMRLQMHATDPDILESRMGSPQSKGCIRIPGSLNLFIDHYGVIDADYEDALALGNTFRVLSKTRQPTPWSGRFLVVVDSGRTAWPAWSAWAVRERR